MRDIEKSVEALKNAEDYLDKVTSDPNNQGTIWCEILEITAQNIRKNKNDIERDVLVYF